ncbi:MAG: superoxide dismutase [Pseudobdellovibrio sp.]
MERRDFLTTTIATSLTAMAVGANAFAADEKSISAQPLTLKGKIFDSEHQIMPLAYSPRKLKGLSEKMIKSHWENNYAGAVKTFNALKKKLAEALENKDTPPFILNGLKREQLLRSGSIVLHENYFNNLGGNGICNDNFRKKIAGHFGSFETWESEFRKIGQGLAGGSGWVIMAYNYHMNTIENYWASDHMHAPAGAVPLLVMDMYEHAYQADYGATAAKYIDAFFNNINFENVEERLAKAEKFSMA